MSLRGVLIGGSLVLHGGLLVALGAIRAPDAITATSIEVVETAKPEPPPPPAKVEPPPEAPAARAPERRAATPAPSTPKASAPQAGLSNLPDFGLELGGGGPGLAVPRASEPSPTRPAAPVTKTLQAASPKAADPCTDGPAKPKLLDLPKPRYTDDARSAGIEGKVRVELTVDETGRVVDVRALTSLGHGLDEAAISAARGAKFDRALRCGRPTRSTFTISIRFSAS